MGKYGKRQLNNDAPKNKSPNKNKEWKDVFKTNNDNLIPTDEDIKLVAVEVNELNKDKVVKAKEQIKEQKSKRGKWFSAVFFVVNLIVLAGVLLYQYNEFGVKDLDTFLVQDQNFKYLIIAFAMFGVIMLMEAIRNYALLLKSTKTHRPILAYKAASIHRYYDNITPLATGGQAFELVYLKSRGVKSGVATSIPFSKYIINQFVFVTLSIILLCFNGWVLEDGAKFTTVLAIITLVVICCAVGFIIFLSVSKKFAPKLILSILKFAQKCRLIKDYNKTFEKIMHFVLEYQRCIKYYASSFWTLITAFLTTVAIYVSKALIAFFIYCTFNGFNTEVFSTIFTKIILCELVVKLVPIPGGSGLSEISFTAIFLSLFDNGSIFWALLMWRILDYFAYLIQGGLIFIYDFIIGNRINAKIKQKYQWVDDEDDEEEFNKVLELSLGKEKSTKKPESKQSNSQQTEDVSEENSETNDEKMKDEEGENNSSTETDSNNKEDDKIEDNNETDKK